jgi:hypothetical protein
MIAPMLLVRSSLKVPPNLSLFQGSPKGTTTIKEELPLKVENMVFDYVFIIDCLEHCTAKILDNKLFLDIVDVYMFGYNLKYL